MQEKYVSEDGTITIIYADISDEENEKQLKRIAEAAARLIEATYEAKAKRAREEARRRLENKKSEDNASHLEGIVR
jgi:D-alanine-D-alanine ligase-like ATP-grasp enzyme